VPARWRRHWHPRDRNDAWASTTLANKSAKFRFHGVAAHAASAPERGRSALDGVEAMNHMVNLMREHVPAETRIHYVIIHGNYNVLPNETLSHVMDASLQQVGGVVYTETERTFAESLRATFGDVDVPLASAAEVQPWQLSEGKASTDVGDVSWAVPTTGLHTATYVPGTVAHSWQAVASGGMTIGVKGMIAASKTLARTAAALFEKPSTLAAARDELDRRRGESYDYTPLLGDRDPPLDYRN
jgi:aminobenzoyl-glutamate utilization protein B